MAESETSGLKDLLATISGADLATLRRMPAQEQALYQRLGATVLISSGMATLGMGFSLWTLTVGDAEDPSPGHLLLGTIVTTIGAILYGLAIFAIDRMLISQPLRPVVAVLPEGSADPVFRHAPARTIWPRLLPRLLLALTIGILVAEPLLLFAFRQAVDQRANRIASVAQQAAVDDARRTMTDRLDGLAIKSPQQQKVEEIERQLSEARASRDGFDREATRLRQLAKAEASIAEPTIVDGQRITGNPKCGSQCRTHEANAVIQEKQRDQKNTEITKLEAELAAANAAVGTLESDRLARYSEAKTEGEAAVERAEEASTFDAELLIRIQALEQLARSEYPFGGETSSDGTPTADPSGTVSQPTRPEDEDLSAAMTPRQSQDLAKSEPVFLGMTAMAVAIWLLRLFFIVLDTMPVLAKTLMSLREVRPYEQEMALRDAQATAEQKLRLRALSAETRLLDASIAEAKRAALNEAGGLWLEIDGRMIFVGPNGTLNIEDRRLEGLVISKRADGSWQLGTEAPQARN